MTDMENFSFGIYPSGLVGTETGISSGYENQPAKIQQALDELQGECTDFTVRAYRGFKGVHEPAFMTPENPEQYLRNGRKLDLVLSFQDDNEDVTNWIAFIKANINLYGDLLECIQITEEANVNLPVLDGYYKHSRKALVTGVIVAKKEIEAKNLNVKVGFNATPDFNPDKTFWHEIASLASPDFYRSLDYAGLDFFPDVFRTIVTDDNMDGLRGAIKFVLNNFRNDLLVAGISASVPVHITENGWSTGLNRSYERQAVVLREIITTVYSLREEFNITKYELFDLRDADSDSDDIFYQFGIMRHDYTPKPAFEVFKLLIAEFAN
jgi:hypothetical protein